MNIVTTPTLEHDTDVLLTTLADAPLDVRRSLAAAGTSFERWTSGDTPKRDVSMHAMFRDAGETAAMALSDTQMAWVRATAVLLSASDAQWMAVDLTSSVSLVDALVRYHDTLERVYVRRALGVTTRDDVVTITCALNEVLLTAELTLGVEHELTSGAIQDVLRRAARSPLRFAGSRAKLLTLGVIALVRSLTQMTLRDHALFVTTIAETYDRAAPTLDRASLVVQLLTSGTGAFDESSFRATFIGQPYIEWYGGSLPIIRSRRPALLDAYVATKDTVLSLLALAMNAFITRLPEETARSLTTISTAVLAMPLYNFLVIASFARLLGVVFARGKLERDHRALELQRREDQLERENISRDMTELRALYGNLVATSNTKKSRVAFARAHCE